MEGNWTADREVFAAQDRRRERIPVEETPAEPVEKVPQAEQPEEKAPPVYIPAQTPTYARKRRPAGAMTTVLGILFLAAVGYGAILSGFMDAGTANALEQITRGYLAGRAESGFVDIALHTFLSSLVLTGGIFLCGFSAVGQPFSICCLLFRGMGLGMSMAHFYLSFDGKGILLALLLLLPAGALSGYALLLGCRESLRLSNRFFRAMVKGEALSSRSFSVYGMKFGILLLMLAAASLLDAGCAQLCGMLL